MRKSFILLMACLVFSAIRAQTIAYPALPNEVCAKAWNNYRKADVLWKTGWGLFAPGVVMVGLGTGLGIVGGFGASARPPERRTWRDYATARAGWSLCGIGSGMFVASIPCLIVGQVWRKNGEELYNAHKCVPETPLTFSIQSSANGFGLAMQF